MTEAVKKEKQWRYSLRWSLRHLPAPGPLIMVSAVVRAGEPCPPEVEALWRPGTGYSISVDFLDTEPIKRWPPERKAAVRRKRLEARLKKKIPLFVEEFMARELAARPAYFEGQ